jgi:hypothetical protein
VSELTSKGPASCCQRRSGDYAMVTTLAAGEHDSKALAQLAHSRIRTKIIMPEERFTGHFTDHHVIR